MKNRNKKILIAACLLFTLLFGISIPSYAMVVSDMSETGNYTLFEVFGFDITPYTIMIIVIIFLLVFVSSLLSSRKHYKDYYDLYKGLYEKSYSMYNDIEHRYFQEQQRVKGLEAWKTDACEVYPDIETQIAELHAAKEGAAFSEKYRIAIPAAYLEEMIRDYNDLSDAAKKYADFDPDTAQSNLDVLKAKEC